MGDGMRFSTAGESRDVDEGHFTMRRVICSSVKTLEKIGIKFRIGAFKRIDDSIKVIFEVRSEIFCTIGMKMILVNFEERKKMIV